VINAVRQAAGIFVFSVNPLFLEM